MTLKTLKDFHVRDTRIKIAHNGYWYFNEHELKEEAIKWVKGACCCYPDPCDCWPDMFMDFFNITEEDLK